MPDDNRISPSLSTAAREAITAALATIRSKLPFLLNLTPEERMSLPKMSDKSLAFDEKCTGYMAALPALVPGYVDLAEVMKDRAARTTPAGVGQEVSALAQSLEDTLMVVASGVWMADLSFYQSVRQRAKHGVAGAQAAYDDLSARFPGGPRGTKGSGPANPA